MDELLSTEMTVLDINSEFRGVSRCELMKNAGKSIASMILKIWSTQTKSTKKPRIAFFCHTGGNGGDGFVTADLLSKKALVDVFFTGSEYGSKAKCAMKNLVLLKKNPDVTFSVVNSPQKISEIDLRKIDIIVDALLGTGLSHKKLREPILSAIKKINTCTKMIISVDVPSGLLKDGTPAEEIVHPTTTISLHKPKLGTHKYGGDVICNDIGIPKETLWFAGPGHFSLLPPREKNSHKGQNGKLLIIAGSDTYHGAPILAAKAALSMNIDLVSMVIPQAIATAVRSHDIRYIVHTYNDPYLTKTVIDEVVKSLLPKNDVLLIGPGLGGMEKTIEAIQYLLSILPKEKGLVVDADGLKAINNHIKLPERCILTPHSTEFKGITNTAIGSYQDSHKRIDVMKKAVKVFNPNIVWLLKGPVDVILSKDKFIFNDSGIPELTVGGTGDALAGLTAGFLCLQRNPFLAATLSSFLIGLASELQIVEEKWFDLDLLFAYLIKTMVEIRKFIKEEDNLISKVVRRT